MSKDFYDSADAEKLAAAYAAENPTKTAAANPKDPGMLLIIALIYYSFAV